MADESAVLDAPVIDTDIAEDPTVDSTPINVEGEQPETPETPIVPGADKAEEKFQGPLFQDGKMTNGLKSVLTKLRSESPAAEARIRKALFSDDAFKREYPGGVGEVREKISALEGTIEELGGADTVKESLGQLQQLNAIVDKYAAGDPRFVDDLVASPEDQDAFVKMGPAMVNKWAELDGAAHSHHVCRAVVDHAFSNNVPVALNLLHHYLSETDSATGKPMFGQKVIDQANTVLSWFRSISDTAAKAPAAPEPRAKPSAGDNGRETELAQRETNIIRGEFTQAAEPAFRSAFQPEWTRQAGPLNLTAAQVANAKELFASRMKAKISQNPEIQRNNQRYLAAKDSAGYAKYMGGVYQKLTPEVLRSVLSAYQGQSAPGVKKAAPVAAGAKPGAKVTEQRAETASKWPPDTNTIDYSKTSTAMFTSGKVVLKNGKTVMRRGAV